MTSFAAHSLHLLKRLLRAPGSSAAPHAGLETVLDGLTAVAATEAAVSDTAALGATWPAAAAGRAWSRRQARQRLNRLGEVLAAIDAERPRGAIAAAIGASASGQRATAFVSGPDLPAASDLLAIAAGQHVPLVMHLAARAPAGHAQALGSGHEAYHAAADQGLFMLFAASVQEAVDLTLVARRVAERSLVPGIVAMDVEQTAMALQDVRLADDELVRAYVGAAHDVIEAPTDAQRMIFGDTRRRVPRLYDLERPTMRSPLQDPESWARGAAGRRPYFAAHVPAMLAEAFDAFAAETGRRYGAVLGHRLDGAEIVLVAQGAAVETLCSAADFARRHLRMRVGVVGVRCLRPLPVEALARSLEGAKTIAVVERADTPLAGDGPLARELRVALGAVPRKSAPRVVDVHAGLGGLALRAADVVALIRELASPQRSRVYLGLDFVRRTSPYPKQQALMDALRRSDPELETMGLRSAEKAPELLPPGATTIAVHRRAGEHETLAGEVASLLHEVFGGHVRSRPALTWQRFEQRCADVVMHAAQPLRDPGDDVPVDLAVVVPGAPCDDVAARLGEGAAVLLVGGPDGVLPAVPGGADAALYVVTAPDGNADRTEAILGAVLALVGERGDAPAPAPARLRAIREADLAERPESEREARLDAFMSGFESTRRAEAPAGADGAVIAPGPVERRAPGPLKPSESAAHALTRFWDQVGVFYRTGRPEQLAADPVLSTGAVPPLTSSFRDVSGARRVLPVFDPATCDGSPDLWMSDPDGAMAPLVISARVLLEAGIELAAERGKPVDALRAVVAKLATGVNKLVASSDAPPTTAGGLFEAAFDVIAEKMDERRTASLRGALAAVLDEIGELPVARTRVFFDEPNRRQAGSGELFSLVTDPDACKSPEIALATCAGRGVREVARTPEALEAARRQWSLWQRLPDTSGATIERARLDPEVGTLAALMLSRHCLHAMAGGDGAEAGSGARLALARVLAVAEFHQQPRLQRHLQEIGTLREKLAERVRATLAEALPTGDLEALGAGLDVLGRDDVDLGALSSNVDAAVTGGRVDGARLGRLVDVARGLADLSWRVAKGPEGSGRARVGLVIAPGAVATWAGAFPYNAFQSPTFVGAGGETGDLARGLMEGQLRQALAGFRFMRWARLELERSDQAPGAVEALAGLRIQDLTEDERHVVPPILVVGDDQSLDPGELASLLGGELSVKVIVLSDIGSAADGGLAVDSFGRFPAARRFDLSLLALLTRRAFVVQTSLAHPEHFAAGVLGAMDHDGPALVVVHAPSPQRHGFAVERVHEQARLAVATRAFPLMRFDPATGGVFGACLDLSGNPDLASSFARSEDGNRLTPVDWAVTERRFAEHLEPLDDGDPAPVPIAELLDLEPAARAGRTPFVDARTGDTVQRLRVGAALVEDAEGRLRFWRTLQELAGVVTPFTAKVRGELERELAAAHDAELGRVRQAHQTQLTDQHQQFQTEAAQRITERLLALVARSADRENGEGAS